MYTRESAYKTIAIWHGADCLPLMQRICASEAAQWTHALAATQTATTNNIQQQELYHSLSLSLEALEEEVDERKEISPLRNETTYVPGMYNVACPNIRCHRVNVSSTAAVRACPKCNDPVTLGGGMTMTNFSLEDVLVCANVGSHE